MPSRRWFYRIITVMCACSCSRVHSEQPLAGKSVTRDSVNVSPIDGWLPHQVPAVQQYVIKDSSTILVNDSTQAASINSRTVFTLTTQLAGDSAILLARVDSTLISSYAPIVKTTSDTTKSRTFQAVLSPKGKIQRIDGSTDDFCSGAQDPVISRIFDLTVTYPTNRIRAGDKWSDTTYITTCRRQIPLHQESIRQYEMLGRMTSATSSAIKIQRITSTRFLGVGTAPRTHLQVDGSGTSLMTLYIDQINGFLLSANGKSTLILNISTARGSYSFNQNILTDITSR